MRRLVTRCAVLLVITAALLYIGGAAYRHTTHYQNIEVREDTVKFHTVPRQIDVAVLGASHGRDAFRFPPEGITMFNFSLSSQTPQYDEKMVLEYQKYFHPNTLIVLTMSYLSPFWTDTSEAFENKQARYYRILSPENIVNADSVQWRLQRFSPLLTEDFHVVMKSFYEPEQAVSQPTYTEQLPVSNVASEKERILRDHTPVIHPAFPNGNPVMMNAIRAILSLCAENGWTAVLVTPPYTAEYNDSFQSGFDPPFYDVFYGILDELSETYHVPYFDYSHDPRFVHEHDLFRNIDHLNLNGSTLFDQIFFEDLNKIGIDIAGQESLTG